MAKGIKDIGIEYVCTEHCTKERAYDTLEEELKDRLEMFHGGLVMKY